MVKRVEHLCEAKYVFGQNRELERSNHLFNDLVQPRRLEDNGPQRMIILVARQFLGR